MKYPRSLKFIIGWYCFIAAGSLITGIALFADDEVMAILFIPLGLFYCYVALGLWNLDKVSRKAALIESGLMILIILFGFSGIIRVLISCAIIYYLRQPGIADLFQEGSVKSTVKRLNLTKPLIAFWLKWKLSDADIRKLAKYFLDKKDKRDKVFTRIYLEYIKAVSSSEDQIGVYQHLVRRCIIQHGTTKDQRHKAMQICTRIIEAKADMPWAHYYLGFGHFYDRKYLLAEKSLSNAIEKEHTPPMAYYYRDLCYRELKEDLSKIVNNARIFLEMSFNDKESKTYQFEMSVGVSEYIINEKSEGLVDPGDPMIQFALKYLKRAIDASHSNLGYRFFYSRALLLSGQAEQALEYLSKIAETTEDSGYLLFYAKALCDADQKEKAAEVLQRAGKLKKKDPKTYILLVQIYSSMKNYEALEKTAAQWMRDIERNSVNVSCQMEAQFYLGRYQKVIANYEKQLKEFGGTFKKFLSKSGYDANKDIFRYAILSYLKLDEIGKSQAIAKELIRNHAKEAEHDLYAIGCELARRENDQLSLDLFSTIEGLKGRYKSRASIQKGHIYGRQSNEKKAEEAYQSAIKNDGKNPDTHYALGVFYYNQGQFEKAGKAFKKAVAVNPKHSDALFGLGRVEEQANNDEVSIKYYRSAVEGENTKYSAYRSLGILFYGKGEYGKAIESLNKARELGGADDRSLYYLGLSAYNQREYDLTIEAFGELAKRYPGGNGVTANLAKAYYLKGCEYIEKENCGDACQCWEKYLEVYDADEKTKSGLANLYFRKAMALLDINNPDTVRDAYCILEEAFNLDESKVEYKYYMALCDYIMSDYMTAKDCLTKIEKDYPDKERILYHMGIIDIRMDNKKEALNRFQQLAESEGDSPYRRHAAHVIANECIKEGQFDQAINLLEEAIR